MADILRHKPVNWIDGMKINRQHFVQQDAAMRAYATTLFGSMVQPGNYGLVPVNGAVKPADYNLQLDGRELSARITRCYGITPGGYLAAISNEEEGQPAVLYIQLLDATFKMAVTGDAFLVCISINPDAFKATGVAAENEEPYRQPFTEPAYGLEIISQQNILTHAGWHLLPIGRLLISGDFVAIDEGYIPPCMAINSHPQLMGLYNNCAQLLFSIENQSLTILKKINQKNQTDPLPVMVRHLTADLLYALTLVLPFFRNDGAYEKPSQALNQVAAVARMVRNSLDVKSGTGKEELVDYFSDWLNINQARLDEVINTIVNIRYNHEQPKQMFDFALQFLEELQYIYRNLADLDYIGRKTDKNIFVKEEKSQPETGNRVRLNIFGR